MRFLLLLILSLTPTFAIAGSPSTPESGRVYCNGNEIADIKFSAIDVSPGNTTVVAAVTGKKIRVLSYVLTSSATDGVFRFESTSGGDALTGEMRYADNGVLAANCYPAGCFETNSGELLNAEVATASFDGHLTYVECQ